VSGDSGVGRLVLVAVSARAAATTREGSIALGALSNVAGQLFLGFADPAANRARRTAVMLGECVDGLGERGPERPLHLDASRHAETEPRLGRELAPVVAR